MRAALVDLNHIPCHRAELAYSVLRTACVNTPVDGDLVAVIHEDKVVEADVVSARQRAPFGQPPPGRSRRR